MRYLIITLLLLNSLKAVATTGNEFLSYYENTDINQKYKALMYTEGILDSIVFHNNVVDDGNILKLNICVPAQATKRQVMEVIVKEVRDDPTRRHFNVYGLSYAALLKAWPCENK